MHGSHGLARLQLGTTVTDADSPRPDAPCLRPEQSHAGSGGTGSFERLLAEGATPRSAGAVGLLSVLRVLAEGLALEARPELAAAKDAELTNPFATLGPRHRTRIQHMSGSVVLIIITIIIITIGSSTSIIVCVR